jgi:uncharacterized membrane protein YkvI
MPKLLGWTSMIGVRSLVTPLCVCEFIMTLSFHLCTKKKKKNTYSDTISNDNIWTHTKNWKEKSKRKKNGQIMWLNYFSFNFLYIFLFFFQLCRSKYLSFEIVPSKYSSSRNKIPRLRFSQLSPTLILHELC